MQRIVRTLTAVLIAGGLALSQGPLPGLPGAEDEVHLSHFSFYDPVAGEVLGAIPHGERIPGEALSARANAVLLSLPVGARGPIELYVDWRYLGVLDGPPYVIDRDDLPARGDVVLLALPDVGYPAEVRFTIE